MWKKYDVGWVEYTFINQVIIMIIIMLYSWGTQVFKSLQVCIYLHIFWALIVYTFSINNEPKK